jgi:hypothetical protein
MPDAAPVTEASTESTTVEYGKPAPTPAPLVIAAPPNPLAPDRNMAKRHQRLASLMADLGEAEEKRTNAKIRGEEPEKANELEAGAEAAEDLAKDEPEEESTTGQTGAEPKIFKAEETEESRLEKRRAQVEKEERAKLGEEVEEADAAALEAAKETPEGKAKEAAEKQDKERKDKFQKVLALEAKAQKEKDRLRGIEGRLVQRERELEQNIAKARQEYQAAVKRTENEVKMARQIMQLAQDNPLALLEQAGATPEDVATWVSRASDPHTVELNKMKRELAERDRREAESQRRYQQQQAEVQRQQQMRAVEREYLSAFEEKGADDAPVFDAALTVYSERERLQIGHELADEAYAKRYSFTHRDIAEAVNAMAMEDSRYKKIQERLAKAAPVAAKVEPKAAVAPVAKPVAKQATVVASNAVTQQGSPEAPKKPSANYKRDREARLRRMTADLDK